MRKQFCKHGHDTYVSGRNPRGDCRRCIRIKAKKYFDANKEKCHAQNKSYLLRNKEKVRARKRKYIENNLHREDLWKRQGIILTLEEYNQMALTQKFMCLICKKVEEGRMRLNVDHDHKTGQIRGLLCHKCNKGLGCFGENSANLLSAAVYLLKGTNSSITILTPEFKVI